jgi:hypothetical protein
MINSCILMTKNDNLSNKIIVVALIENDCQEINCTIQTYIIG